MGGVADPTETRYSLTCYHAKFGCSRSNRLGVDRKFQKFRGRGPPDVVLETRYFSTFVITPNVVALGHKPSGRRLGVPEMWGRPKRVAPWDGGVDDPQQTHSYQTCVILPNIVAVVKSVWAR